MYTIQQKIDLASHDPEGIKKIKAICEQLVKLNIPFTMSDYSKDKSPFIHITYKVDVQYDGVYNKPVNFPINIIPDISTELAG